MSAAPPEPRHRPLPPRAVVVAVPRRLWAWLAGPGAVLVLTGVVLDRVLGSARPGHDEVGRALAGGALILGLVLLLATIPVLVLVARGNRRHAPSGDRSLPWSGAAPRSRRRRVGAGAVLVAAVVLAATVLPWQGYLAEHRLERGMLIHHLRHSASTLQVTAVLDRDTTVQEYGRGKTYTDHVSYTVAGHVEHDIAVEAFQVQPAGTQITVLVEPDDPGGATAYGAREWDDLVEGVIGLGGLVVVAAFLLAASLRASVRAVGRGRRRRRRPRPA